MRLVAALLIYTALVSGANGADAADLGALRTGEMRKLVVHDAPRPVPEAVFLDAEDGEHPLSGWRGRVVVLNFWATWCAPCRKEMPALGALERALGGEDFAVVPVATGRNSVAAIGRFFAAIGVENLPILRDPTMAFAREMAVMGLPVTVILDREGRELARLTGDADWAAPEAQALIAALIAEPAG